MPSDPYAPPKAEVRDVSPERPSYWIRTGWFYLAASGGVLALIYLLRSHLTEGFTAVSVAAALGLTALLAVWPMRAIAVLQSCSVPWWWNVLFFLVPLLFLAGAFFDDEQLMVIGLMPYITLCGLIGVASLWVESRYAVRVYSTTNSFIFVKLDDLR